MKKGEWGLLTVLFVFIVTLSFLNLSPNETPSGLQVADVQELQSGTEGGRGTLESRTTQATCGDCSACSGCASMPSNTCILTNSISNNAECITVTANNVVIDCNGFTIDFANDTDIAVGIDGANVQGLTVQNCRINHTNTTLTSQVQGIRLTAHANASIVNNTFFMNASSISGTHTNLSVVNNTFFLQDGTGVTGSGNGILVQGNIFNVTSSATGVSLTGSVSVTVHNNTFSKSSVTNGHISFISIRDSQVSNNTLIGTGNANGISATTTNNTNITNNNVISGGVSFGGSNYSITNNVFRPGSSGDAWLQSSGTFTSRNNTIIGSTRWIAAAVNSTSANDSFNGRTTIFGSNINFTNSTFNGTSGALYLNAASRNISVVNATIRVSGNPPALSINGSGHSFSDSHIRAVNSRLLDLSGTANTTFSRLTLETNGTWLNASGIANVSILNFTFNATNSSIRVFEANLTTTFALNQSNLNVSTLNRTFLNSSNLTFLNNSAQITLRGLTFTDPEPLIDVEDDGTFAVCSPPDCVEDSYSGGVLVLNVTHFTSHAARETVSACSFLIFSANANITTNQTCDNIIVNSGVNLTINSSAANNTSIGFFAVNFTLHSGALLNATSTGFSAGQGAGAGTGQAGAGHGGRGGPLSGTPGTFYGSSLAPLTLGSGASNSRGGGAIYIQATTAEINGTIEADGTTGGFDSGGGAGGSIFVNATTVLGTGTYRARGGLGSVPGGSGGGGGGGRIAIHADNLSSLSPSQFNVSGGIGRLVSNAINGTAGTAVWFDKDDLDLFAVNSFRFQGNDFGSSINNLRNVTFLGAATEINASILFNVTNWTMENTSNLTGLSLENITLSINASDRVVLNNISVSILNVSASTIDILSTANIEGHGRGFFSGQGSGTSTGQAGAGHGGRGGSLSGTPGTFYGSSLAPITLGSGSNNGRGGGRVIMNATTFNHNGTIQMDGGPGGFDGGGGAGGSIFINASTVSGNGSYFARGGRGGVGGGNGAGGGGGRIAVHGDSVSSLQASQFNVTGGIGQLSGVNNGTPGTAVIFDRDNLDLFPVSHFRFQDNDFASPTNLRIVRFIGAATEINASILFNVTNWTMMNTSNLTALSLENITLSINASERVVLNNVSVSILNVSASTIDVLSTATINGQARGFAAGQGAGSGTAQAGAAHGGNGGTLSGTPGSFYGSSLMPLTFGSGGSNSRGAGRVIMNATAFTNNGTIQVDGGTGGFDSGGGGGGSIFINASTVSGNGSYYARGGQGATPSGSGAGGGGGRIAVHADDLSSLQAIQFNVTGGTGTGGGVAGNPGTSVLFDRNDLDLVPVNNFRFQTDDFSAAITTLRTVRFLGASTDINGSIAFNVTNWTMANSSNLTGLTLQGINLTINASDRITLNNVSVSVLNLSASAIDILSTATISGKARGLTAGQGPGNATAQAGAGHGGSGGALSGTPGTFYGSSILPILMGSGGSNSRGGGIIAANATTFTNNGTLQADGGDGGFDSGGGGGGSVFINATTVSGNGSYYARGGQGSTPTGSGGGGGGGRIAIYGDDVNSLTSSQFNVTGGAGTGGGATGGTGTAGIFDKNDNVLLLVQGWRWQGNDEPLSFTNVTVARGAAVLSNGSSVNISDTYTGDNSTLTIQTGTLILNSTRFISRNATFSATGTTRLSIGYRTFFDDTNSTYSSGTRLNLRNISVSEVNWSTFTALVGNLSTHTSLRDNFVRANSTAQPGLNVSANITLYGISVPDPFPIFDDEDDGTYSTCSSPRCTELSYSGSTFIFNVSRFTTYSTAGGVNFSKSDSPDPVTSGNTLLYTIFINNTNGNITNVTVVETYPPQVVFNGSQPAPTIGNNTFVIGNLSANATFQINITVNVSSGVANGTVINNTANLTFQNLSNVSFNATVTENTTVQTAVLTCPLNLTTSTTLTENLTCPATAVNIFADNVQLDCNGFNISYANNETGFGVNASSRINTTVRNCNIFQGSSSFTSAHAVSFVSVNHSAVINTSMNVTGSSASGVTISSSNNVTVTNVTSSSSINSLQATTSTNITFNNSRGIGSPGLRFTNGVNIGLINNSIAQSNGGGGGIELSTCNNINLLNTNASNPSAIGLFVSQCFNSHIQNVTATGSSPAIQVQNSANNTLISVNGTSSASDGIRLSVGRNITLANSTGVTNLFSFGITTQLLNDSVLTGNTGRSTSSGFGISITLNSRNITLHNNTASAALTTSNSGLLITSSHNSTITNNSVSGGLNAILATSSTGNYFANNTIANPAFSALHLYLSLNDTLIEDNFIPNGTHSLVINETNGVIAYVQTVNFTSAANLSQIVNVTLNNTFVNSTNTSALNRTAQLTLFGLAFTDPRPVFDFDDDGIFAPCDPPQCVENLYAGGTFVFNVTGFTAYASDETPLAVVNITFDKSDNPDPVPAGGLLNYTIEINVSGDTLAQNVTVVDSYPLGVTFVSSSPAATGANDTFSLGNLTNGTSFVINITVNVSSSIGNGTILNNSVNLSFLNSTNGTISAVDSELTTVIGFPQLSVTKTDSPDPVNNGSTLTYTITVTNTGDDYSFNVTALDIFPANVTFNGSSLAPISGNDTYDLGNLSPNQSVNFTITVNVSGAVTSGTLTNNVTVNFTNSTGQLSQQNAFQSTTVTTPSVPAPAPSAGGGGGGTNLARNAQINRTFPQILQPVIQRAAAPVQSAPAQPTAPSVQTYEPIPTPIPEPLPAPRVEPQPIPLPQTRSETSIWPIIALIVLALFVLFVMTRTHSKQPPVRPQTQKISTQKLDEDIRELKRQLEQTKKILRHKIK